ncbi:MAG: serine protease Do [Methylobacteriaceae bacterium]|nr:serine protease Do [Methylobacteriaceae bacterium]
MASWRTLLPAVFAALSLGTAVAARAGETDSYAEVVAKVMPSVVNISVKGMGEMPMMDKEAKNVSYAPHIVDIVGSGSIVDANGLIVTNRHVIDNAYEITVTLQDGTTHNARLLGKGLGFDLAILKVDVGYPLPAIKIGDSDEIRVGDRVLAIGNPLGLKGTVTSGIISALHRDLNGTPYNQFIQVDAAINHGNSGGPLFNMKGEVIGINNQIFSESSTSGSIGLGFAIPSNDVAFMLDQIRQYGRPHLGWLGLKIQTVNADMSEALKIPMQSGAIISEVTPGSPADEAGLKVGDIIQAFADEQVIDYRALNRAVAMAIGKTLHLSVWQVNGDDRVVPVTVKEWPQELWESYNSEMMRPPLFTKLDDLGFQVGDLTNDLRARFHLDPTTQGPVVTEVVDDTAASNAKLKAGDIILKVQRDDIRTVAELEQRLKKMTEDGDRRVLIYAKGINGARWTTMPLRL